MNMKFKDFLVHMDNTPHCPARLSLAINLARRHNAHLTGLYVIAQPHYQPRHESIEKQAAEARALFDRETAKSGISAEWVCADWPITGVSVTEIVNLHAYHKDLVIVGQTDHSSLPADIPPDLPELLIRNSGRPILIVPFAGAFRTVGERVMVAWKSGRESTRALNDAMPFLQDAQQVRILRISSPVAEDGSGKGYAEQISAHLARHGIVAKMELFAAAHVPIGDLFLNQAWEGGCDLLVMGAYTHNARGTLALGPAALHVLRHMTMPVLMSH
jgi:nucleotide-binding universal stress UspA family protein